MYGYQQVRERSHRWAKAQSYSSGNICKILDIVRTFSKNPGHGNMTPAELGDLSRHAAR
jgi:hypothetical protein